MDVFESHKLEWSIFGKTEPWWSVLTDDKWKGMKDVPANIKDPFYASSYKEAKTVEDLFTEFGVGKRGRNMALDFGTGVGRLALMLKEKLGFDKVVGIDQSFWHIETARKEIARKGFATDIQFRVSNIDLLKALKSQQFNFVLSNIVLQHMVPPLMVAYIEQFCDALLPGGHGFFQVPTYLPADYSQFKCDFTWSITEGGMQLWYLEAYQVAEVLSRRGCTVLKQFDYDAIGVPGGKSEAFFFRKIDSPAA